jgi:hypothetical protein
MSNPDHFVKLYDKKGNLSLVCLSAELWVKISAKAEPLIDKALGLEEKVYPEPMHEWEAFLRTWDFRYPVETNVQCLHCGAASANWAEDPQKPFHLKSAQLGGLVVFDCKQCGATVRKKHFKDHACFEFTLKS